MMTPEEIAKEARKAKTTIEEAREEMIQLGLPLHVIRAQIRALEDGLIVPLLEEAEAILR